MLPRAVADRRLERGDEPVRDRPERRPVVDAGQEQHELVPADARDHVVMPHRREHPLRRDPQHQIAGGMAMRVVHLLEEIEIEMQERERPARVQRLREDRLERAPVAQPGERVGQGLMLGIAARPVEAMGEPARFLHRDALGLEQVEHLGGEVGGGEIGPGEPELPHRIRDRDPEGEVEDHPATARGAVRRQDQITPLSG